MTLTQGKHIAVVSDVSLGFGSPQIPALARSLATHYDRPATVYEPNQPGRPPISQPPGVIEVRRIMTDFDPHSLPGRIEYVLKAAAALNRERPAVLMLCSSLTLPVLLKLRYRPQVVVYALLEMVSPYGRFHVRMNRLLKSRIDLVIYPEANRARIDAQRCGFVRHPSAVMYNVNDAPARSPVAPDRRWKRLFYGGAISGDLGMADYLLHPEMNALPLDIYGDAVGRDREQLLARLRALKGERRYLGCVDAATLARKRRKYAFALVMYRPRVEHTLYAAPNKFFEAIADGVPPIVAPHPQCKLLVERYRCGIVMRDWSFGAYREAVTQALSLVDTSEYTRLVRNCRRAVRAELNWTAQFGKVRRLLPSA